MTKVASTNHHQATALANAHPCVVEPLLADTLAEKQTTLPLETPDDPDDPDDLDDFQQDLPAVRPRKLPWASLLKRSLGIDGLACPGCGAQMVLLALITAPDVVVRILDHLRIPSTPPHVAPARPTSQCSLLPGDELDQTDPFDDETPSAAASKRTTGAAAPRAPP